MSTLGFGLSRGDLCQFWRMHDRSRKRRATRGVAYETELVDLSGGTGVPRGRIAMVLIAAGVGDRAYGLGRG